MREFYFQHAYNKLKIANNMKPSLRYHHRWIDSVWKLRSYADALKENPINLTFSESLIIIEYNHTFEIF